jgi:predicted metal-dependent RNase
MKKTKGDVAYRLPKKKKPIAYSTKATSDLIVVLAQEYETITDVYHAINYDQDAKDVLKKYIDLGYGDVVAREWFR